MRPLKISAVSYLNTKPFIYGLEHSSFLKNFDLQIDIPSVCAEKLLTNQVDIALAPVAVLPELNDYEILTDYCIGCDGKVNSVMLFSEVPLAEIETIYLDYQSKTSVLLIQLLAEKHWKIFPNWLIATAGYESKIGEKTAGLVIGDRSFALHGKFNYQFDLGEAWEKFTGLPFVFACWVANKPIPEEIKAAFNKAVAFGIENKFTLKNELKFSPIPNMTVDEYLEKFISYQFDQRKKKALELFLNSIPALSPESF
ncbi:MAG: hypothetical protein COA57_08680 [Flavobacteriales bacterium]|nr:MAG: hypothetical protein COA57_08680 [Flavobacteriales bacterium]